MAHPLIDSLSEAGDRFIGRVAAEIISNPVALNALARALQAKQVVDAAAAAGVSIVNLPTGDDMEEIRVSIRKLTARLDKLERDAAATPAAASPTAQKKAASQKTARKTPASKKATRKKPASKKTASKKTTTAKKTARTTTASKKTAKKPAASQKTTRARKR